MAKTKTAFVCGDCGSDHNKWQGQCADCGAWNTLAEIRVAGPGSAPRAVGFAGAAAQIKTLQSIDLAVVPANQRFGRI